ncbi:MAG: alpha-N-arabinofuranosidase [Bacteroidales bacterium]|nr:alpha-N-arabinofuranosidase [Bacteroidales bacterium]
MKKILVLLIIGCFAFGTNAFTQTKATVDLKGDDHKISRHIYGHFSEHLGRCIYDGIWVGENSSIPNNQGIRKEVIDALKGIGIPNLRWPGGCFADEYHWKDGIGPKDERPPMINTHWGMVSEDNSFGTHEFLRLCNLLDAEPVIAGNVGSGTVKELSDWVEYVNSDIESDMTRLRKKNGKEDAWYVKYWGVGNESWGCGGNMNPTQYYEKMVRYSTYMRSYPDKPLYKVAVGPSGFNPEWTEEFMKNVAEKGGAHLFSGYSLHYYTVPGNWQDKGSATEFGESEWFTTIRKALRLEDLIEVNARIIDKYLPDADIDLVVDEWGCWHNVETGTRPGFLYQQNTLRDALVAGLSLNIFNNHSDRVKMANIAQTVNVLQAMVLTREEQLIKTPTYHVFDMYQVHHDATYLPLKLISQDYEFKNKEIQAVTASASEDEDGKVHITFTNADPHNTASVECAPDGDRTLEFKRGEVLTHSQMNAHNTFEDPKKVTVREFNNAEVENGRIKVEVPAKSVVMVEFE